MINFTIITCTFNAESVLQRTLHSVQEQSWDGINHIIIDGKSKDRTVELAELYKSAVEHGDRVGRSVTIICEPDKGIYDAMNKGLRMAMPDYVLFLNAGDTFHTPDTLKDIVAQIDETKPLPGVIYGDTDVVDATNRYVGKRNHQPPEVLTWRSFQRGMLVCHQAFYARTDIAQCCNYDLGYHLSGDIDWCIRVMKEAERLKLPLLNTHMVLCNFLAGGLSVKKHKQSLHERFVIMVRHYGLFVTIFRHILMTYNAFVKTKKEDNTL